MPRPSLPPTLGRFAESLLVAWVSEHFVQGEQFPPGLRRWGLSMNEQQV